jgi:hypothetical protein
LQVLAEYVWLGGSGADLRSITKVLESRPESHEDCPVVTVDGSLCGQASGPACELFLKPRKLFKDPFRGGDHLLVLCDTFAVSEVRGDAMPPRRRAGRGGAAPMPRPQPRPAAAPMPARAQRALPGPARTCRARAAAPAPRGSAPRAARAHHRRTARGAGRCGGGSAAPWRPPRA